MAEPKSSSNVHSGAFPGHYGHVRLTRGECTVLEERYPGIRFNRVSVDLFALHWFQHVPDTDDYVSVNFNISGTKAALKRHGFDAPSYVGARVPTKTGERLSYAKYVDGLERLATVFIPSLLTRFCKEAQS